MCCRTRTHWRCGHVGQHDSPCVDYKADGWGHPTQIHGRGCYSFSSCTMQEKECKTCEEDKTEIAVKKAAEMEFCDRVYEHGLDKVLEEDKKNGVKHPWDEMGNFIKSNDDGLKR